MSDQIERKKPIELPENVPTDYEFERMLKNFFERCTKKWGNRRSKKKKIFY